jgi:hypothetical protein
MTSLIAFVITTKFLPHSKHCLYNNEQKLNADKIKIAVHYDN